MYRSWAGENHFFATGRLRTESNGVGKKELMAIPLGQGGGGGVTVLLSRGRDSHDGDSSIFLRVYTSMSSKIEYISFTTLFILQIMCI